MPLGSAVLTNGGPADAAQRPDDNLSFKRRGMTRRSMPRLFHANLFVLDAARWLCQYIGVAIVGIGAKGSGLFVPCSACGVAVAEEAKRASSQISYPAPI